MTLSVPLFKRAAMAVSLTVACASASAALPQFTFDPTAAGLTGTTFTSDNLLISNYSTITFGAGNTFTETGYLTVGSAQLGGSTTTPGGLNSTYGLYISFSGTGTLSSVGNPATVPTFGELSTLTYTLYGYNGTASFGVTGTTPTTTALNPIALATGTLVTGNVSTLPVGNGTGFTPGANATLTVDWLVPGAFTNVGQPLNLAMTSFSNTASQVETFANGFVIRQGGGSINFAASPVPEPSSYAMFFAGLAALGFMARRRSPGSRRD